MFGRFFSTQILICATFSLWKNFLSDLKLGATPALASLVFCYSPLEVSGLLERLLSSIFVGLNASDVLPGSIVSAAFVWRAAVMVSPVA